MPSGAKHLDVLIIRTINTIIHTYINTIMVCWSAPQSHTARYCSYHAVCGAWQAECCCYHTVCRASQAECCCYHAVCGAWQAECCCYHAVCGASQAECCCCHAVCGARQARCCCHHAECGSSQVFPKGGKGARFNSKTSWM
eukprot:jgi/Botrbrau1/8417/Bobra.0237s0037.1